MNLTEFAAHCGLSRQYIGKLVGQHRIPTLTDGSIDPVAGDRALARIRKHSRARRFGWSRPVAPLVAPPPKYPPFRRAICLGCHEDYSIFGAEGRGGPADPEHFCSRSCEADVLAGLTYKQIRAKMKREAELD